MDQTITKDNVEIKKSFFNSNFLWKMILSLFVIAAIGLQTQQIYLFIQQYSVSNTSSILFLLIPSFSSLFVLIGLLIFIFQLFSSNKEKSTKSWSIILFLYYIFQTGLLIYIINIPISLLSKTSININWLYEFYPYIGPLIFIILLIIFARKREIPKSVGGMLIITIVYNTLVPVFISIYQSIKYIDSSTGYLYNYASSVSYFSSVLLYFGNFIQIVLGFIIVWQLHKIIFSNSYSKYLSQKVSATPHILRTDIMPPTSISSQKINTEHIVEVKEEIIEVKYTFLDVLIYVCNMVFISVVITTTILFLILGTGHGDGFGMLAVFFIILFVQPIMGLFISLFLMNKTSNPYYFKILACVFIPFVLILGFIAFSSHEGMGSIMTIGFIFAQYVCFVILWMIINTFSIKKL